MTPRGFCILGATGTLCLGASQWSHGDALFGSSQGDEEPRGRFVWEHVGRGGAMGTLYLRGKYMFSVVSKPQERGPIGVKHRPCFSRSVSMRRTRTGASGVIVREGNDRHPVKRETRRRYRWEGAPDPYDSMTAWISKQSVSLAPTGKRAPKQYVPVAPTSPWLPRRGSHWQTSSQTKRPRGTNNTSPWHLVPWLRVRASA